MDNNWLVAPALGDSHTHKINQRLILSRDLDHDYHVVMIDKSVECNKIAIRFKVNWKSKFIISKIYVYLKILSYFCFQIKSSGIRSITK